MGKLTVAKTRSLTKPGRYGDGLTLFLVVAPGGTKSWVQRLTINGSRRDIGLGGWPLVSLAEARDKAIDNRRIARSGRDPRAERRREKAPLFEEATMRTFEGRSPKWRNAKHAKSWLQTVQRYAFPVLGPMRVDQIDRQDVLRVLDPIWATKKETARRVRQRIHTVLSWCQSRGFVDVNVAGELISGALPAMGNDSEHLRSLPHQEMAQVLRLIAHGAGLTATKLCFLFTVLTAVRGSESRLARWEEFDFDQRVWNIPAKRTKTNKDQSQPLSPPALDVLEQARVLDDGSRLVFPSAQNPGHPLSDASMMVLLQRNGLHKRMTVHGCRASFRTWADEHTHAPHAVKELSLGHHIGDNVVRAYARSELIAKRRDLMDAWGRYVTAVDESPDSGDVGPVVGSVGAAPDGPTRASAPAPRAAASSQLNRGEPVALVTRPRRLAASHDCAHARAQLGLFGDSPTD